MSQLSSEHLVSQTRTNVHLNGYYAQQSHELQLSRQLLVYVGHDLTTRYMTFLTIFILY